MLAAVILSGGASQRMGSPKALLPCRGGTFLEHLLEISTHPKIGERRIVLGPHADAIRAAVPLLDTEVVVNPEWEQGQLSSIHAAIHSVPANVGVDGMILFLVDHPLVSARLVGELIQRFYNNAWQVNAQQMAVSQQSSVLPPPVGSELSAIEHPLSGAGLAPPGVNTNRIVLPTYKSKRGHPVIFGSALLPELLAAPIDQGARAVVWAHTDEIVEVPTTEAGCVMNVNDTEAFQRILEG
jgi:CTP:molybdopterin cytidylyltransferase MocA